MAFDEFEIMGWGGTSGPLRDDAAPATLILEDGSVFYGISCGAPGEVIGRIKLDSSMIGYHHALSAPENTNRIMCMTYPQIGNYGICVEDLGEGITAGGMIMRSMCYTPSNFRMDMSLPEALIQAGVPAIEDIDTRALTRILRANDGEMYAALSTFITGEDEEEALFALVQSAREEEIDFMIIEVDDDFDEDEYFDEEDEDDDEEEDFDEDEKDLVDLLTGVYEALAEGEEGEDA